MFLPLVGFNVIVLDKEKMFLTLNEKNVYFVLLDLEKSQGQKLTASTCPLPLRPICRTTKCRKNV